MNGAGALTLGLALLAGGCAAAPPPLPDRAAPLDVVIVPGCPNRADGRLSLCQAERAVWAAMLWERGAAQHFITSGAAVHSPYEEAESLAAAMVALGVPADRIDLESRALHTDENMFLSLLIAGARGHRTVGVASQPAQAGTSCTMLRDWGQACVPLGADRAQVIAWHRQHGEILLQMKTAAVRDFLPLRQREALRAAATHGPTRPPSYFHYLRLAWLHTNGQTATPDLPAAVLLETYADRLAGRPPTRLAPRDPIARRSGSIGALAGLPRAPARSALFLW